MPVGRKQTELSHLRSMSSALPAAGMADPFYIFDAGTFYEIDEKNVALHARYPICVPEARRNSVVQAGPNLVNFKDSKLSNIAILAFRLAEGSWQDTLPGDPELPDVYDDLGLQEMLNQNEVRFVWAFEVALGSLFLQEGDTSSDSYYNAVRGKKYTIGERIFFPLNAKNTMLWAQMASTRCNAIQGHIPRRLQSFKSFRATYTDIGNLGLAPVTLLREGISLFKINLLALDRCGARDTRREFRLTLLPMEQELRDVGFEFPMAEHRALPAPLPRRETSNASTSSTMSCASTASAPKPPSSPNDAKTPSPLWRALYSGKRARSPTAARGLDLDGAVAKRRAVFAPRPTAPTTSTASTLPHLFLLDLPPDLSSSILKPMMSNDRKTLCILRATSKALRDMVDETVRQHLTDAEQHLDDCLNARHVTTLLKSASKLRAMDIDPLNFLFRRHQKGVRPWRFDDFAEVPCSRFGKCWENVSSVDAREQRRIVGPAT